MIEVNGNIARGRVPLAAPLAASRAHIGGRPLFSAGVSRLRDSSQVQTMPANSFGYDPSDDSNDDSNQADDSDSGARGTYVEIDDEQHPDAYHLISSGGDEREDGYYTSLRAAAKNAPGPNDMHDEFAEIAKRLAKVVLADEPDKTPFMAYPTPNAADIVDLLASDEVETDFQDVYDEFKSRHTDDETENDE
jgi:hypothetical protein